MQRSKKVAAVMLMLTSFAFNAKANIITNSNQVRHQEEDQEQILKLEYGKPLKVTVSSSEIYRISFAPNVIVAIWGDNTKYSALLSKNGSELFLTTKVEENKKIHLSKKNLLWLTPVKRHSLMTSSTSRSRSKDNRKEKKVKVKNCKQSAKIKKYFINTRNLY